MATRIARNLGIAKQTGAGLPREVLEGVLACMRDHSTHRGGSPSARFGKTKARLRLMLVTGLSPSAVRRIQPEHIDWHRLELTLTHGPKATACRHGVLPLEEDAVEALRAFHAAHAYGYYSLSSAAVAWRRASQRYLRQVRMGAVSTPIRLDVLEMLLSAHRLGDVGAGVHAGSRPTAIVRDTSG